MRSTGLSPLTTSWLPMGLMLGVALVLGLAVAVLPAQLLALLLLLVGALVGLGALYRHLSPGAPAWIKLLLLVVLGHLVLNYGFANVMFKIGGLPLPVTDLVLGIGLIACAYHLVIRRDCLAAPAVLWVVLVWAVFNLALHLPRGLQEAGVPAARDALPTLEMLFVLPSYVAVLLALRTPGGTTWLVRFMVVAALAVSAYNLLYPFQPTLLALSPRVPSFQQSVPILGNFGSTAGGQFILFGVVVWIWQREQPLTWSQRLAAVLCIASSLLVYVLTQGRAAYVYLILSSIVLMVTGSFRRAFSVLMVVVAVGVVTLGLIEAYGVEVKGRVTTISLTGIYGLLASLDGESKSAEFAGAAHGVLQRRQWREYSLSLWSESPATMVWGAGFGQALTDHLTVGTDGGMILVREPHNSYVSSLTRSGLLGLAVAIALQVSVLYAAVLGFYRYRIRRKPVAACFAAGFLWTLLALLGAWGQPFFENPYFAVPTYFVFGAVLALQGYMASTHDLAPDASEPAA